MGTAAPPTLQGLAQGVLSAFATFERQETVRGRQHLNREGGDIGHHRSFSLVVRHTVNYALAGAVAAQVAIEGPLVDVGAGAGAFSAWLSQRLGRRLVVVEPDPGPRLLAERALPGVVAVASVAEAPPAPVVTAMEVVEHVPRPQQRRLVGGLASAVLPGGVMVLSTPDETRYLGGWSGYAPHVAPLSAEQLEELVREATGWETRVWRISGPGFQLGAVGRVALPLVNRVWWGATRRLPRATAALTRMSGSIGARRSHPDPPPDHAFRVTAPEEGDGTGLLAAAWRPLNR